MNNRKVVILGRNYTSLLGMVRAVGVLGCDITVIRSVNKIPSKFNIKNKVKKILFGDSIESKSKYVKKTLLTIELDREYLINLLLMEFSNSNEEIILIPTDDFTASTIDLFQDKLKGKFLYPNIENKKGEVVKYMDKKYQKNLVQKYNLNTVKTWTIDIRDGKFIIPSKIIYPVFTKPQISFKGDKTFMQRCNNEDELCQLIKKISKKNDCPILVEQYVEIQKEYGVLGCAFDGYVYIPGFVEKISCGSGSHKGVTLKAKSISWERKKELHSKLCSFMKSLNFNGLFDIELYESNGIIYFNELNLRFGAEGYGITGSGVNLPSIYVKKLCNDISNPISIVKESIFISDKVNLDEYENGYITWNEYKDAYNDVDFRFIKSKEDKMPYYYFKRFESYIHLKTLIKKILKKIK